jgi:hypothetical protein
MFQLSYDEKFFFGKSRELQSDWTNKDQNEVHSTICVDPKYEI